MNKMKLSFTARDPFILDTIVKPIEKAVKNEHFVRWGEQNYYPQYIYNLYLNTPTLQSAVNTCVDYVLGDEINSKMDKVNETDTVEDLIRYVTFDYVLYGGFAVNIVRNKLGTIAAIYHLDFKNIRSDKKKEYFYYSEDWTDNYLNNKTSYARVKAVAYPKYVREQVKIPSSIFYYTNTHIQTYPLPFWGSGVVAAEMEKRINEYQLNNIINGFSASYIVNLNNGVPSDEVKEEIERNFNEKFGGSENSGRLVISYNDNKDAQATIEAIPEDKLVDRYQEAAKRAREQLLSAFRANPVIIGIPLEGTGFSDQDITESFSLFNKTVVKPLQNTIVRVVNDLLPTAEITIDPFTIDFSDDGSEKTNETINE